MSASPPLPWLRRLNSARPRAILALSLALIALIGLADYAIGNEISLTLFYLLPISLLAWFLGGRWGAAGALLAGAVWLAASLAGGLTYSAPAIYVWNSLMRLATNGVVAYLFSQLRRVLRHEQQLARTDDLTGALNGRAFYEALQLEIARANRYGHPLTLAYVDLDSFKSINDQLGHNTGDELLRVMVRGLRGALRANDLLARLGGDEFVVLLPETGAAQARAAMGKVHACLLAAMQAHQWPVTFSLGVLVCPGPVPGADELVRAADALMYDVKRAGKNGLRFGEYSARPAVLPAGLPPPDP